MNSFNLTNDKNNFNKMAYAGMGKDDKFTMNKLNATLSEYKNTNMDRYIHYLTEPEICINAKIPSHYPVPTSSVKLHNTYIGTTNSYGNFVIGGLPFYINDVGVPNSTFFYNSGINLDGTTPSNYNVPINMGQTQPAGIYASYRLVSASLVCSPRLSPLNMSGTLSGGIYQDVTITHTPVSPTNVIQGCQAYTVFSNIDNSLYNQCALSKDGLRLLYFPVDPVLESFSIVGASRPEFGFFIYGQGLPANSSCVRFDFYANFECGVTPSFSQWIPKSLSFALDSSAKQLAYNTVSSMLNKKKYYDWDNEQQVTKMISDLTCNEGDKTNMDDTLSIIQSKLK